MSKWKVFEMGSAERSNVFMDKIVFDSLVRAFVIEYSEATWKNNYDGFV